MTNTELIATWKRIIDVLHENADKIPDDAKHVTLRKWCDDDLQPNSAGVLSPYMLHFVVDLAALSDLLNNLTVEFLTPNQTEDGLH